jgi:hypothetical protein
MNRFYLTVEPHEPPAYRNAVVAAGFWIRVGFIGVSSVAISAIVFFNGDASPMKALAGALGGAAVAVFAWRRSWLALDRADAQPSAIKPSDTAQPIDFGQSVARIAHH